MSIKKSEELNTFLHNHKNALKVFNNGTPSKIFYYVFFLVYLYLLFAIRSKCMGQPFAIHHFTCPGFKCNGLVIIAISNSHGNWTELYLSKNKGNKPSWVTVWCQGGAGVWPAAAGAVLPLAGSVFMVAWTRWGGPTGTPGPPAGFFGMLGLGGRLGFWRTTFSPSIVWHRVMGSQLAPLCFCAKNYFPWTLYTQVIPKQV